jgi:hypothetical protein
MSVPLSAANAIFDSAIAKLREAQTQSHQVGDKVDEARNEIKKLTGVAHDDVINPVLILIDTLESNFHHQMVNQVAAVIAAIESVK